MPLTTPLLPQDVLLQHKQAFAHCRIPSPPPPGVGATEGFRTKAEPVLKGLDFRLLSQ